MALKVDLCSVMHAKMLPGKGLGFNHSGSQIFTNLSLGKNAPTYLPCLSWRNEKQHYNYNHKVLCMSARRATKLNAVVIPLEVGDTRQLPSKVDKVYTTTVVSVKTLAGPKGGIGEICHIVLNHGGKFSFVEGQFLHVHFQSVLRDFSIASSRNGDSFDGQTLSLCVRRADLTEQSVSNYLCNLKPGDEVQISGPVDGKMVFVQEPPEGKHIMVGTATGIAPFRSNLQRLFVDPNSGVTFNGLAAWLISGADDYNSLLYDNEFTQIEKDNSYHFKYQRALNNSVDDSIYEGRDEIFRLLNGGAYIYFAGSKSMMPEILEIFEKIAQEKGVDWKEMLRKLKQNGQWRVEVY